MKFKTKTGPSKINSANLFTAGFSWAEFLILVAVITVLAWLVLPMSSPGPRITRNAQRKAALTQISTFGTALDMFRQENGTYPNSTNGLNDLVARPPSTTNWHQYMEVIPLDPWAHSYIYTFPGKHNSNSYDLYSMGPDGRAGTEDDIVNWQLFHAK